MVTAAEIAESVRLELGDLPEPFRTMVVGNGEQDDFELTGRNLLTSSVSVFRINEDTTLTTLNTPADYTLDANNGTIHFTTPPPRDSHTIVEGQTYGIFNETEINHFINAALDQHLRNRTATRRYRDGHGFIKYDREPMTLETLPTEEKILVTLLSTVEALWALSTDASMDIDVSTSEGTHIPRGQRWRQLIQQIDVLTDKYKEISLAMGVGLFAPEVVTVRRKSKGTGRLVPVFIDREYDETGPPVRAVPEVSQRDGDEDGPASPWYPSGFGH